MKNLENYSVYFLIVFLLINYFMHLCRRYKWLKKGSLPFKLTEIWTQFSVMCTTIISTYHLVKYDIGFKFVESSFGPQIEMNLGFLGILGLILSVLLFLKTSTEQ